MAVTAIRTIKPKPNAGRNWQSARPGSGRGDASSNEDHSSPIRAYHIRWQSRTSRESRWMPWTLADENFLRNHYRRMKIGELAVALGRTFWSVRSQIAELKKKEGNNLAGAIRLKEVLERHELGVREFAKIVNVPVTNLCNLLNSGTLTKKDERAGLKVRISEALLKRGISERDIFNGLEQKALNKRQPTAADEEEWEGEMLSQSAMDHFGLAEDPFEKSSVRGKEDLFVTDARTRVREIIIKAVSRRGFLGVWGEVGSGKTLLWTEVEASLGEKFRVVQPRTMEKERLTIHNLQEALITDLRGGRHDYTEPLRSSHEARDRQIQALLGLYDQEGIGVVLLIEEAHRIPLRTLKALKSLHELQFGFSSPLAIVLLGQPELKHNLWDDLRIREVTRRCRLVELPKLRPAEIPEYLGFKFKRVKEDIKKCFSKDGLDALAAKLRTGAPALQVNNLAVHALNHAADICHVGPVNAEVISSL